MTKQDKTDFLATVDEIRERGLGLLEDFPLNRFNDITARADCLRLIRASVELAPTLSPLKKP